MTKHLTMERALFLYSFVGFVLCHCDSKLTSLPLLLNDQKNTLKLQIHKYLRTLLKILNLKIVFKMELYLTSTL